MGSMELVLSKAGLTCLLPLGLGVPHEVCKGIGDKRGARCYFSCPWQWCYGLPAKQWRGCQSPDP